MCEKSVTRLVKTHWEFHTTNIYSPTGPLWVTLYFTSLNRVAHGVASVVGRDSLWQGFLCKCATCTKPPCDGCVIPNTLPHSKCNFHLWESRGRECSPKDACHGCAKYLEAVPEFLPTFKKLYRDRGRQRNNRQTEVPPQDSAAGEFQS